MYTFVTHTWNTVKGECPHDCSYCYMKRLGIQIPARFDESELNIKLGNNRFIFVGSSNDLFAAGHPDEWIIRTLEHCSEYPDNKYLFQTKNPRRFLDFVDMPFIGESTGLCTTIETNRWYPEIMGNTLRPQERATAMEVASKYVPTLVTIEPMLDFDLDELVSLVKQCNPRQVQIGADSGGNNLPEPELDKIIALIDVLKTFTKIDQKRNLKRLLRN